jgi:hypothetical protein
VPDHPEISLEQKNDMKGKITLGEASEVLKSMKANKSPGTSGFSVEFFKMFWRDLGPLVTRALNEGFERGMLSVTQREGIITCIPKGDKPREYIKNWRPITLLNTVYKIGSSCIANRIKKVLPNLISEDQTGFMSNRYIGDNVRFIYDMIDYLNYKQLPGLLLCIDFEKAFDSMSWIFLVKVLRAYGFHDDIVRWVKTFLCNIQSTVMVNGTASSWFSVRRGCRQGDPISPYLFILCVEICGIMIRENQLIKGISIDSVEHKILQFADDTQMMTQGEAVSFEQIVETVENFGRKSGLKMNPTKTQAVWLGSKKNSDVRFLQHLKMDWNPPKFKILGVWLTSNLEECENINYFEKFAEIKILFRIWMKRNITPLGRVAILKSLILSKLVHLWMLLPNPPDNCATDFQKAIFKFIWNKKQDRISRKNIIKNIQKGGLGVVDIKSYANSLKLAWIRKLEGGTHRWRSIISSLFPMVASLRNFGESLPIKGFHINKFWRHVFLAYECLCKKIKVDDPSDMLAEPLFYNNNIPINVSVLRPSDWIDRGITRIEHLLHADGTFLSNAEFRRKYEWSVNFLSYTNVVCAVKKCMKKQNVTISEEVANTIRKALKVIISNKKGSKIFYDIFCDDGKMPEICEKWNRKLDRNINWLVTFTKIKKIKEIKLKWFQIRIINRIIATNRTLQWMKVTNDDRCSFCKDETETIEHLFWGCDIVQGFWLQFMNVLQNKCVHLQDIHFCEELILLGHVRGFKSDDVFDTILLMGKYFIYTCKHTNTQPIVENFLRQLKYRFCIEKYLSNVNQTYDDFVQEWRPYVPLFDVTQNHIIV